MHLYLIRHAHAGSRSRWDGDDEQRPLSPRGEGQARIIADQLASTEIDLLWTSPSLRCRQTLEPLATRLGLEVEVCDVYDEGNDGPPALDAALEAASAGQVLAVCSHGDVIPAMVRAALDRGAELVGPATLTKGSRYDCTIADGQITRLEAVAAPDGET